MTYSSFGEYLLIESPEYLTEGMIKDLLKKAYDKVKGTIKGLSLDDVYDSYRFVKDNEKYITSENREQVKKIVEEVRQLSDKYESNEFDVHIVFRKLLDKIYMKGVDIDLYTKINKALAILNIVGIGN